LVAQIAVRVENRPGEQAVAILEGNHLAAVEVAGENQVVAAPPRRLPDVRVVGAQNLNIAPGQGRRVGTGDANRPVANMCVESHLRELIEQGFEVAVVKDATAAPKHPTWGYGYTSALINYAYLAHAVLRTDEVVQAMKRR
jgi:hypothetical protein